MLRLHVGGNTLVGVDRKLGCSLGEAALLLRVLGVLVLGVPLDFDWVLGLGMGALSLGCDGSR